MFLDTEFMQLIDYTNISTSYMKFATVPNSLQIFAYYLKLFDLLFMK